MKTKIMAGAGMILLLLAAAPSAFGAVSGGTFPNPPNFYISSPMVSLCGGAINNIPITITNTGVVENGGPNPNGPSLQSVELTVSNTKGLYAIQNSTAQVGTINPDNSAIAYVPVFVSANSSSIVSVGFVVNYYFYSIYTNTQSLNLTFGVEACPKPLSISLYPDVLTSGKIQNVSINLTNTGSVQLNATQLRLSLPGSDGTWLGSQPIEIGAIAPSSSIRLSEGLLVYRNASQSFPINITAEYYRNGQLEQISNSIETLSSGVIGLTPTSLTISPQTPSPGSIFSISFVLTNIGTAGASAVTATALPNEGVINFGSNSVFVGDVAADTQTPVTLTMLATNKTKQGSYTVPIRINYLNSLRQNESITTQVPVYISASAALAGNQTTGARFSSGSATGGLITLILLVTTIAFGYLYYKERKKRHAK